MNFFKINVCVCFVSLTFAGVSQTAVDSVKQLKTVEISTSRLNNFAVGNKTETLDSTLLNRYSTGNLADLLANESQVFIKSYGLGSLATSSFRGAGAEHTTVLWNGFNLQSPMNGLIDLSLIPTNFVDEVKLQYGGAGALWGSGAVGGTIHLNNSSQFNKGISVVMNTSFGSFSDMQQQARVEISKKRFVSSLKIFNHDAKNDFPFINNAQSGSPEQKQSNAELKEYGLLQENYFQINKHQKINTRFWYQFNDRNIPPSMTQNINVANQKDELYRATTEWQRTGDRVTFLARLAYFDEGLRYSDSLIHLVSISRTKVTIAEAESRFSISKFDLVNIGINNTYSEAIDTSDFVRNPNQNKFAVFANYKLHSENNNWNAVISGRQEFIKGKTIPFVPSLGLEGKFLKCFYIKGNVAEHYHLPTFNELYWGQGGNPDLKPEIGWSEEISLSHKLHYKAFAWEIGATVFNRNIDNWIIWLPNQYGIWTPENVLQVWSRGVEYKVNAAYSMRKFKVQLSGMYNYVLSTNQESTTSNDVSLNKQLIYVPIQNAQGNISISYKGTSISYILIYTGYRYTTSDNLQFLNPYTISNISVAQTFLFNTSKIKIFAQLNNIWNETYQVLAYRAMPLLNYQVGLSVYFNQPNGK